MSQPISIDHIHRRITIQVGRVVPVNEARADVHRLLDLALDALDPVAEEEDEKDRDEARGRDAAA